jgi:hypothetical protein
MGDDIKMRFSCQGTTTKPIAIDKDKTILDLFSFLFSNYKAMPKLASHFKGKILLYRYNNIDYRYQQYECLDRMPVIQH